METPKDENGQPEPRLEVISADSAGSEADDSLSPEEREAAAQFLRGSFRILPDPKSEIDDSK